ncbi:DoxX family protein [Streptomyces sp. NPDC006475]|uniref:DoxX family protein n=1 Tax=Streptomyces sp. NPDC006475 TaxID=3155719 RepID=UPI0033B7BEF4
MNVVLWISASLLAVLFLGGGAAKLLQPKEKLTASPNMAWAEPFSPAMIKLIGLAEVLAAIVLILPALLNVAPLLVPLAATGLILMMIGAMTVHGRRKENQAVVINVILLVLAAFVAWGRFGPHAF